MLAQHEYLIQLRRLIEDSSFAFVAEQLAICANLKNDKKAEKVFADCVRKLRY